MSLMTNNFITLLPSVVLSEYDKAHQLVLTKDQLTVLGCKGGYRMVRATHGVHRGSYYWEMEVLEPLRDAQDCHIRVGWSTKQGELQAGVGYDKYSYGYRDLNG
jgi:Set1/Ash2 histone methyltransferase complex subunit ASH2